jgi:MoxR-like ATPase
MADIDEQEWWIFKGKGEPRPDVPLPEPPSWRVFGSRAPEGEWQSRIPNDDDYWRRARTYRVDPDVREAVNAALWLRRPLLVTGSPGTGKTTLIYRVAYELGLGPVYEWAVNSRSRLKDALYEYDSLARLQDHQRDPKGRQDLGQYITLRALGTALLPSRRPRAVLIDEIDKADPDLPNDLLNLFEEGSFEIPELLREKAEEARVRPMIPLRELEKSAQFRDREREMVTVTGGTIRCHEFPFVVLTSNREREFPPAFLRRCIRVELPDPNPEQLGRIVAAHLGNDLMEKVLDKIELFSKTSVRTTAVDQFLNSLYLVHKAPGMDADARSRLESLLMNPIKQG